ncbi:MAG: MMPL family transporter [Parvularcula sp.]|jgi:predicted RND superfamily exporter protein|nr:MMPL family transporter [Parvularcula sp.]
MSSMTGRLPLQRGALRSAFAAWPERILNAPRRTLAFALLPFLLFVLGMTAVRKDPSVDAFVTVDNPAAVARDEARELFGIEDPVVVVFAMPEGESAFQAPLLSAVAEFARRGAELQGVDGKIISIASERAILASDDRIDAPLIVDGGAVDPERAYELFKATPPLAGALVSHREDALLAIVPVEDPNRAELLVDELRNLARTIAPEGVAVHLGGVATMNARLSNKVSEDTVIFLPAALLVVALFLYLALRRWRAIIAPLAVVALAAVAAVGSIGLASSSYFLITTALPVVVMAIAVADSIHLTLAYQRERTLDPGGDCKTAMAEALRTTWKPIVLTTVTTALGFLGLAWASPVKPIADFGLFAAIGTLAACFLSLTFLPICQSRLADPKRGVARPAIIDPFLALLARQCVTYPRTAIALSSIVLVIAGIGASRVEFDYDRRNYFLAGDPVLDADTILSERFYGANILDVVVDTDEEEGALTVDALQNVAELSDRFEALSGVRNVRSYADNLGLIHERLTGAPAGEMPTKPGAAAQYMMLYEASGDPEDFDDELDFLRQQILLRASIATGVYTETAPIIAELSKVVGDWQEETGYTAKVSGRIAVNDGWMSELRASHAKTIGAALLFVALATTFFVGGVRWGLLAMLPVVLGVSMLYGAMGLFGIDLAPATSMCAAIAAGLGVDFGIHLITDLRRSVGENLSLRAVVSGHYTTVMRACLFSAASLGAGFCVVALSQTPVLQWFGLLIAFAAFGSAFGALVLIPAITSLIAPRSFA